jgi:hypothetical protein
MPRLFLTGAALVAVALLFMGSAVPSDAHGWVENPPSRNFLLATYNYARSAGNGLGLRTSSNSFQNPIGQPGELLLLNILASCA